jgi:hypothetical protein
MDADPRDQRIRELEAEVARLGAENEPLRQLVKQLQERIEELERAAARQAAPFRRKDKDRKPPDPHQTPGRKPGHPPAHRPEPPQIDDHVEVRLPGCPHCGGPVDSLEPCEQIIEDLPPVRPHVTRLITDTGRCARCGDVRSTHPMPVSTAVGAAKVHRGARAPALGAHFAGVLTRDGLAGYENLPYVMHKCYAHPLQAIAAARDRKPEDQRSYFHELSGLLDAAMTIDWIRGDLSPPEFLRIRQNLDLQADALILPSRTDPDEERVANRLRKRRQGLFTFLDHPGVEPTNNRAERALRPAVIARKLSCGNKTERGKRTWEILASLAATCHQRGQDLVELLRPNLVLPNPFPAR